ncbi:MAG: DNA methyltransferase, partial [Anaerolineales bacterium]
MPQQPTLMNEQPTDDPSARDAEREAYRDRLRAHLQDPEFRAIEGFPLGEDEDILALSDPPTYTACPNPFLPEIIAQWQEERRRIRHESSVTDHMTPDVSRITPDDYHREPFATDVSGGKHNPIYYAHSYHTKVPHPAIMRYILHYTDPGDIVLDGFCGTGMTGVAAQLCGDREAVRGLGYVVDDAGAIYDPSSVTSHTSNDASRMTDDASRVTPDASRGTDEAPRSFSRLGARKAVLVDLSPAATFIAYNYNTPVD